MSDFEKLGIFYLGRQYDIAAAKPTPVPVLYESRDLVTHAVCVGMTGSGKTGLCLGLLEEAALDGVPVIAIDPKGDLGNLLLTFPGLSAEEFRPWIDEDEAHRSSQTPETFAEAEAGRWKAGLADWGQDGERIARLRAAADFAIYTPGSGAGLPVSILSSFAAPPAAVQADREQLTERASATATSVLSLAGSEAAPRSREHTLLSTLVTTAWTAGQDVTFESLIQQVQSPPMQKVGILDLESFFPQKDRFELALQLNGVIAAPGFEQWFVGEPLDPASLLRTAKGKPRVSIFSIAHLGDTERMFFVSLLLNQIVGWMRTQTGTSSLRAIVYMDEIAGFFPPVANPPSKAPLLTMLKQARAFGVGVVLATQNPVDLDYKGLANTGTWFLGRLQTERDKARVLDGLEGAATGGLDRSEAERLLSALGKRMFLLHNVHDTRPIVFQTRWTMSYLRGPMSRQQITQISGSAKKQEVRGSDATESQASAPHAARTVATAPASTAGARPIVPPGIEQYFLPDPAASGAAGGPVYSPVALGAARITFTDARLGIDTARDVLFAVPIGNGAVPVDWQHAEEVAGSAADLQREPAAGAQFADLPSPATQPKNYPLWQKAFAQWLMQSQRIELLRHGATKLTSTGNETEREFRARVQDALREGRDAEVDAMKKKFSSKRDALAEKLRKAEGAVSREQQQASQQKTQTMFSVGAAAIGALLGRKVLSTGTLGRATTAARGMGRSMKEAEDVQRAGELVKNLQQQLAAFDETVREETQRIADSYDTAPELGTITVAPKRGQVGVQFVALGWDPR
ncbi:MAG: ATP-binding protein [Acidobacteriota bacterium]|nr:ATP-binding protein [Acidobacteriota bacterium]